MIGRCALYGLAVVLAGAAGLRAEAPSAGEKELAERLTVATKSLIAALPAELATANSFAWGGAEHRYWHWVPSPLLGDKALGADRTYAPYGRFGVPVEKMDTKAIDKLHDLLKVGLSGEGYRKVQLIIRQEGPSDPRQSFIGLGRSATSSPPGGPDWYFVSFFGSVGSDTWAVRFEGHHVSLTWEIEGGRVRFSPSMIGFNPSPLPPRSAELAMNLYAALPEADRKTAHLVTGKEGVPADCTRDPKPPAPVGLKLSGLSDDAKWYLLLLLEEYIGNYPEVLAKSVRSDLHKQLAEMTFAWWGPLDHAQPHFYRLQGPSFLIEMRHQGGGSTKAHIHGVYRSLVDRAVTTSPTEK